MGKDKNNKKVVEYSMPQIALGDRERIIKRYSCADESRGNAVSHLTEVTITSRRFIKSDEYIDGKNKSCTVEQVLLGDIKSISHGKFVGHKSLALLVWGIILCPVLIGIGLLVLYFSKPRDVGRWLSIHIKIEKANFKFGEQITTRRRSYASDVVYVKLYEGINHLGEELFPIIFDIAELGPEAAEKKWNIEATVKQPKSEKKASVIGKVEVTEIPEKEQDAFRPKPKPPVKKPASTYRRSNIRKSAF